jgi:hypothetical protein
MKSKQQKQQEALERKEKCANLSLKDRIKLIKTRPGNNKKELAKLEAKPKD